MVCHMQYVYTRPLFSAILGGVTMFYYLNIARWKYSISVYTQSMKSPLFPQFTGYNSCDICLCFARAANIAVVRIRCLSPLITIGGLITITYYYWRERGPSKRRRVANCDDKIRVSRGATLMCCQLNTICNEINYFIDWKQKYNNKMYSLNYVEYLRKNIWQWHPAITNFFGSIHFCFSVVKVLYADAHFSPAH